MNNSTKQGIADRFAFVAQKLGAQIHLRSLRDAFASIMPFMILAGFMTLINYVILEPAGFMGNLVNPDTLTTWQSIGVSIANGTLNIMTLLVAVAISYHLCVNRGYKNVIAPILVVLSTMIVVTPLTTTFSPEGSTESFLISNVIPVSYTSASGMFVGIIVGLLATDLFIKLSSNKKMQINISGNIPPAVIKSFNVLIPIMVNVIIFAVASFLLNQVFNMDFNTLISTIITKPLSYVTTSLPGFLLITSIANLFFGFGIHQAVISGALLDPFLLQNMQDNMLAYANHQEIPHIINMAFKDTFAVMGGSGNTIALLIAIFIFSRRKDYRDISKMSLTPSIFNISEPIIFGLPIVFNPMLIIPFVLAPIFSLSVAYFATALGLINHVVVQTPWTTPPIISGFLATGGDWRASVLQLLIIIITVFMYLPFLKVDERVSAMQNK
ncbi:PTS cellobiose transporter subunit IIC [Niallia circulans]|jgi:cellobiose PTS system EIIC component|uniref:Permease IIC component n=2 Tax=Niallia circulans TaxID=1397 RepID=A0A0J1I7Y5_NIACI|nr:PTS sugar transporter subunit IIC [Niallia circulans]KLV22073.1 PTS cellobiose transporter subunit IIC [Niallia circulans]MCM2983228.1 PTS sugar transporter subunit IIC [Niallia circulans]MDR4316520.1 PTS sugar transporter subunit IIC [Niallia circulans]MED3838306.1 PTS sugar transporter subunit IIC [Niallia circulans]MED4243781.1 PTS sugar transporter subunit IIC [Niallia circulans]